MSSRPQNSFKIHRKASTTEGGTISLSSFPNVSYYLSIKEAHVFILDAWDCKNDVESIEDVRPLFLFRNEAIFMQKGFSLKLWKDFGFFNFKMVPCLSVSSIPPPQTHTQKVMNPRFLLCILPTSSLWGDERKLWEIFFQDF